METTASVPGGNLNSHPTATTTQAASALSQSSSGADASDDSTAPDDQMPKRASFMGIPPEMRLRIYDFLLDGSRITDMLAPDGSKHFCRSNIYHGPRPDDLRCTCAKIVFPQILAANKTVFAEAAPVLYATRELRIALPRYTQPYNIDTTLAPVSDEAKSSITKAVLPTSLSELDIVLCTSDRRSNNMTSLWNKLAAEFPRLRNVRLQIGFNPDTMSSLDFVEWQQLNGVLGLPGIKSLDVEVLRYTGDYFPGATPERLAARLDASLRAEISRLGKSIKMLSFGKDEKITPREG